MRFITLLALAGLTAINGFGADRGLLFQPVAAEAGAGAAKPQAKRVAVVKPDLASLKPEGLARGGKMKSNRQFIANLFPDVVLPVTFHAVELDLTGSWVWSGTIDGEPGSTVTMALNGDSMSALFSLPTRAYAIHTARDGSHEAREIDSAQYPGELLPIPVRIPGTNSAAIAADAIAMADSANVWDVLVAYTDVVRQAPEYGSAAAVQSLISNAVAATNTAYENSGVTARLRLVGTVELAYDDRTTTFSSTLTRLRSTSDGYLDSIHALRATVGADVISLLVYNPTDSNCGLGYLMQDAPSAGFAPYAFNVVRDDCAVNNLSFPHELGHNFGLAHDLANAGSSVPAFPYAYGYQDTASQFRDIMAYNCPGGCPRIQYFSNPDISYGGRPLGVNYLLSNPADNRRALNNGASTIANWVQSVAAAPTFTDDPLVAGTTWVKALHLTELRTAINSRRATAGLSNVVWTDANVAGLSVKALHITEMRNAIVAALSTSPTFTDPTLLTGVTAIKAVHIQELRNLLK